MTGSNSLVTTKLVNTDEAVRKLLLRIRRKVQLLSKPETPRSRNCMFYSVAPPRGMVSRILARAPTNDTELSHEDGGMTSIFPTGPDGPDRYWNLIAASTAASKSIDAAVGAMLGLVLGDAFRAPLEFLAVRCDPNLLELPHFRRGPPTTTNAKATLSQHPHLYLTPTLGSGARSADPVDPKRILQYHKPCNKFHLRLGQWTDDASMALCLADSLIATAVLSTPHDSPADDDDDEHTVRIATTLLPTSTASLYHDGDCRVRYCNWWFHGYNNAFRFDRQRKDNSFGGTSVGLGGNISASLYALQAAVLATAPPLSTGWMPRKRSRDASGDDCDDDAAAAQIAFGRDDAAKCPFVPDDENSHDSGNGSLMRLAPAALRCWSNPTLAQSVAEASSYTTHGGEEAAAACRFVSYFISRAVSEASSSAEASGAPHTSISKFLDCVITEFIAEVCRRGEESGPPYKRIVALLRSQPPSPKEACWDWKAPVIAVRETLAARGAEYQGYPVSHGYFGSYALDGLAMALWAMHEQEEGQSPQRTFLSVLYRVVNLLGDCDSTGAITCQMAGAYFGYRHIAGIAHVEQYSQRKGVAASDAVQHHRCDDDAEGERLVLQAMMACVKEWDPLGEIGARGIVLHHLGRGGGGVS
jgi:ADP-ribosylglycohydrolase